MKKFVLLMLALCAMSLGASAQRFALIDMEYILQNVPAYESANSEIEQLSKQWQAEVQKAYAEGIGNMGPDTVSGGGGGSFLMN